MLENLIYKYNGKEYGNELELHCSLNEVHELLLYLYNNLDSRYLIQIQFFDQEPQATIVYTLFSFSRKGFIKVYTRAASSDLEYYDSVSYLWKNASLFEDRFFLDSKSDDKNSNYIYRNLSTNEKISLNITSNEGMVIDLTSVDVKQLRFFQKYFNRLDFYNQSEALRSLNPVADTFWQVAFFDYYERLNSVEVTDKAKAIRMLMMELNRIFSHMQSMSTIFLSLQNSYYFSEYKQWSLEVKELLNSYYNFDLCVSFNTIGGVRLDLPAGWVSSCLGLMDKILSKFSTNYKKIATSSLFKERLNSGVISKDVCIEKSITGPLARASGLNFDFRKLNPIYFYADVDFEVPVGQKGSVLDRYLIMLNEVRQSAKIVLQIVENIPSDSCFTENSLSPLSLKLQGKNEDFDAYKDALLSVSRPELSPRLNAIESSHGLIAFDSIYLDQPYISLISNQAQLLSVFPDALKDEYVEDIDMIISSLAFNCSEVLL